jgi:hypothetical protein
MTTEGTIYDTLAAIKPTWAVVADQGAALPRFTFSRVVGVLHETVADGGGALRGRFQIDSWA